MIWSMWFMILSIAVLYIVDFHKEYTSFCFKLTFSASKLSNQKRIRHIRTLQKPSICYHLMKTLITPFEIQYFAPQRNKSECKYVHLYMCVYIDIHIYGCFQNSQHCHISFKSVIKSIYFTERKLEHHFEAWLKT